MTPREAGRWENPERPDPRESGVRGARTAPRLRGAGVPGKWRTGPRAPGHQGRRAPKEPEDQSSRPGLLEHEYLRWGWGVDEWASAPTYPQGRLGLFSAWFHRSFLRLSQSRRSSWGDGSPAHRGDARPDGGSRRAFCDRSLQPSTRAQRPPGCPGETENGLQDPLGAESEGACGSRAPARSPAAQTGVELGLQRNLDAEKQRRRGPATSRDSGERKEPGLGVVRGGPRQPEGEKESELTFS